ncbi:MAG TPA: nitronate monooxygenase, partial [Chloroflexota bacterium]|nr:nitronate monooxygenase [Chloroflexota bacterium]
GHNIDAFHEAVAEIRKLTRKPFGVDLLLPSVGGPAKGEPSAPARGEVDPRYWRWVDDTLEHLGVPPASGYALAAGNDGPFTETPYAAAERQQRHIDAIIKERPAVFAAGLGSPAAYIPALHQAGITVFGLVGNVKTARRVQRDGVDVIVAQGYEAGGHTGRVGTFALVPQVVDAVSPTPVVLAGGVGDGRAVAAALALGAQAVWVGTAFLATPEANILPEHRQHVVDASDEDTRVTRLYSGKTARALHNPLVEAWEQSGLPPLPMGLQGQISGRLLAAARAAGRNDLAMQLGGQIAGSITAIRPAHIVLEEMVREAVDVLTALSHHSVTFVSA